MIRFIALSLGILLPFLGYSSEPDSLTWPREIDYKEVTITLYQPQLEDFENNSLTGRLAVSVEKKDKEMIFGAIWFRARLETDLDERICYLKKIDIERTAFPDVDSSKVKDMSDWLEGLIEEKNMEMSLDHLLATLQTVNKETQFSTQLKNDAPPIFFRTEPSVLVYIDGEPIYKDTESNGVKYVVNTPFFLVHDTKKKNFFMKGDQWWYVSKKVDSGWEYTKKVPSRIKKLAEKNMEEDAEKSDSVSQSLDTAPGLIVVTGPAELVMTDGKPEYTPIEGTNLLYVKNTEDDILMEIGNQKHYLLMAGRWYSSKTLEDGDWQFQEPDQLPADFAKIPKDSDIANIRSSVPGTEEAQMAVLEQTIPQTATIDRKTATTKVQYDGNPEFEKIPDTKVARAKNSDKTVLLINNRYYVVDEGIWFESAKATGPWEVSVSKPSEVDDIPPSSEVYNVKYTEIYGSTSDVVYVGYTPGYTCSYVYSGVVVYGTGYWYHPWYRSIYYPRPVTWGFHVHYNPWTGWGFSYGISYGWFGVGFHRGYHGWWGPAGYRYGYRHGYARGFHHGYRHGYRAGARAGYRAGYRHGQASAGRNNVYRNRNTGVRSTGSPNRSSRPAGSASNRPGTTSRPGSSTRPAGGSSRPSNAAQTRPSNKSNNVYSGKNGNTYQRNNNGSWQQRNNSTGSWQNSSGRQNQNMNRQHNSRQQGSQRYNSYNSNRSSYRSSGGGRTGGGGGRRR